LDDDAECIEGTVDEIGENMEKNIEKQESVKEMLGNINNSVGFINKKIKRLTQDSRIIRKKTRA